MAAQTVLSEPSRGREAVVMGGSLAGLLAARVLSDQFDRVTLIERDRINDAPESRKGQPHTRHIHGLLASGYGVLRDLFPGLAEELCAGGAIEADMAEGVRFYAAGGYTLRNPTGLRAMFVSRPFLEWKIARRVLSRPNVRVLDQRQVRGFLVDRRGRITGVRSRDLAQGEGPQEQSHAAALVLDATGRASSTPRRLKMLGFDAPHETVVKINLTYTTRIFRRERGDGAAPTGIIINPDLPSSRRLGGLFPIEEDRWILTVGGWGGDQCALDEASHREFVESLAAPDILEHLEQLEPMTELYRYRFAANLRRHYEKLKRFPEGLLVMGDAIASFNPVYGQGMSSAALQAKELQRVLANRPSGEGLWKDYFRAAGRIVDGAWQLAVGSDFAFAETEGPKPPGTDIVNRYVQRMLRAAQHDPVVHRSFIRVQNLLAPPSSLFRPDIVWRVLARRRRPAPRRARHARPA